MSRGLVILPFSYAKIQFPSVSHWRVLILNRKKNKLKILCGLKSAENYQMYQSHGALNSNQISHAIKNGCSVFWRYTASCFLQDPVCRQTDSWHGRVSQKKWSRLLNVEPPSAAPPWAQRLKLGESLTLYNPWVLLLFMLTKPTSASGVRRINMKRSVCTHCTASSQIHRTQNSLFIISTQGRRVT